VVGIGVILRVVEECAAKCGGCVDERLDLLTVVGWRFFADGVPRCHFRKGGSEGA